MQHSQMCLIFSIKFFLNKKKHLLKFIDNQETMGIFEVSSTLQIAGASILLLLVI
jgi:hypothetical protein